MFMSANTHTHQYHIFAKRATPLQPNGHVLCKRSTFASDHLFPCQESSSSTDDGKKGNISQTGDIIFGLIGMNLELLNIHHDLSNLLLSFVHIILKLGNHVFCICTSRYPPRCWLMLFSGFHLVSICSSNPPGTDEVGIMLKTKMSRS